MRAAVIALLLLASAAAQCPTSQPDWLPILSWRMNPAINETLAPGASVIALEQIPKSRVGAAVLHVTAAFPVSVWFGQKHLCEIADKKSATMGCALPAGSGALVIKDDRSPDDAVGNSVTLLWASLTGAVPAAHDRSPVTRSRIGQPETVVAAGRLAYYQIFVPAGDTAYVGGTFEAEGGSGNDIYVYLTASDGLTNLLNHHEFRSWFSTSGPQTAGAMNVGPLGPGVYYLVFDNEFSAVSNKVVTSDIELVLNKH